MSVEDISKQVKVKPGVIKQHINTWATVTYINTHKPGILDLEGDSITNLERVLHNASFINTFGIKKDSEGIFKFPEDSSLIQVLIDLYEKSQEAGFTRVQQTSEDIKNFVKELYNRTQKTPLIAQASSTNLVSAPTNPDKPAHIGVRELHANLSNQTKTPARQPIRPSSQPRPANTTNPSNTSAVLGYRKYVGQKGQAIFKEYKAVQKGNNHPIACAVLCRAYMEAALTYYAIQFGVYSESARLQDRGHTSSIGFIKEKVLTHIGSLNLSYSSDLTTAIEHVVNNSDALSQAIHKTSIFDADHTVTSTMKSMEEIVRGLQRVVDESVGSNG